MPLTDIADCHKIAEILALIGESNRLRILLLCYDQPHAVSDIATQLDLSLSLTSHHLRLLRAMRVLKTQKQGKQIFYSLDDEHIRCILKDVIEHFLHESEVAE